MAGPTKIGAETHDLVSVTNTSTAELSGGGLATAEFDIDTQSSALLVRYYAGSGEETDSVTLFTEYWSELPGDLSYAYCSALAITGTLSGETIISATIGLIYSEADGDSYNYNAILKEDGNIRTYFTTPDDFATSIIASSDSGQFMLVGYQGSSESLSARIYDEDGALLEGSISFGESAGLRPILSSATAIEGGYVVAWTSVAGTQQSGVVSMQLLDPSGEEVGDGPIEIAANGKDISVKALEGERFIVTWTEPDGSGAGVHAQLYSADGATIGDEFIVNSETGGDQSEARVTELADGGYVVVWTDASGVGGDSSGTAIKGQVFAATGERRGDEFLVNTDVEGSQNVPDVVALAGDRFKVSWDAPNGVRHSQIFDASNLPNDFVAPTIDGLSDDTVAENTANRTIFGLVEATDAGSAAGELRFELLDDADGRFTIGAASGAVRVADSLLLDYEQEKSFTIEVRVTDAAGNFAERELTIHLDDVSPETVKGDGRDNLIRAGAGADSLLGGDGADTLEGGAGADTLDGDEGADRLVGGKGSDRYGVDDESDVVVEASGGGNDEVRATASYTLSANVEALTLRGGQDIDGTGNSLANRITGGSGDNTLDGKGGADRLDGGLGADVLIGRGGADVFRFTTAIDGGDNVDAIKGFSAAKDTIELAKSVFSALSRGVLDDDAFVVGGKAADDEDRIIYKSSTGALLYDRDGAGGADVVKFATLGRGLDIDAEDFRVI